MDSAPRGAAPAPAHDFLEGGGEVGALMRAHDWARTALGPVETWPQSLRTSVSICLASRFPILLFWGSELIQLYNDAFRPILGETKHPWALGRPGPEVWAEIWDTVGPMIQGVVERGEQTYAEDLPLVMDRNGYAEETYFTYSYSPIRDESGGIGGLFCACIETTAKVIGERRLRTLRDLAARGVGAESAEQACRTACEVLAENPYDLPFAALYIVDSAQATAHLAAAPDLAAAPAFPTTLPIVASDTQNGWPLQAVIESGTGVLLDDLAARFTDLPMGGWSDPPQRALILPLIPPGRDAPAAVLVTAVSPRRHLDEEYRGFYDLVAGQITAALAEALAFEQERHRAEALAELDRAKTTFFSNVSHEFRTPLTLMLTPLEDLLASTAAERVEAPREALDLVYRNGLRLQRLVNTLLDFSRIEAGRVRAHYEPTDLAALTIELATLFRSAIERAGLRLSLDCPPLVEPVYVDHEMWEQIVFNLLSNALKFTHQGEIAVTLRAHDGAAVLTVRDTGIGIARGELPRLFERFHQVVGAQGRTQEGSGIGLALMHELVKLHGGQVQVESAPGVGSRFIVAIPLGAAHLPQDQLPVDRESSERPAAGTATRARPFVEEAQRWVPEPAAGSETAPAGAIPEQTAPARTDRPRVLLADDNADMRRYIRRLLSDRYEVEVVPDGVAALEAARERPPDLILADIMMPRLDGLDLVRALRADERTRTLSIILLSARAGEESRVEGLAAGADDFLIKPFSARELRARVDASVELARLRHETAATLREQSEVIEAVHRIGQTLTSELDLDRLLQALTEVATELTGAEFGSFFYNVLDESGESYMLYTLSGVPRSAFEGFPMPRNTPIFSPTFRGEGVVRLDDVMADPRYGTMAPHHGMPQGHLPVRSYLAVPVISRSGEVLGGLFFGHSAVGVFTDRVERLVVGIAAQAGIAVDNARLYAEAREAIKIRDEFLSIASHELRNPVAGAKGAAQMLRRAQQRGSLDPERTLRYVGIIEHAVNRLATLIEDLLDVSRLQRGEMPVRPRRSDVEHLVRGIVDRIEPGPDTHRITVELTDAPKEIVVDPDRFEQIVENLLSNAMKYSPGGGEIRVALTRMDDGLLLRVHDDGIGLPPDSLERIFEPFGRAANAVRRNIQGLGLGLYICRRIAEQHHGRLWAESDGEGRGTTMLLWLPTNSAGGAMPEPDASEAPSR